MGSSQVHPFSLVHPEWELSRLSLRLRRGHPQQGLMVFGPRWDRGVRPSSARDRIATLLMWPSLNNPVGSLGTPYFRTTVAKRQISTHKGGPGTVPGCAEISFRGYRASTPRPVMPPGSTFSCVPSFQFQAAKVRPIARRFLAGFFARPPPWRDLGKSTSERRYIGRWVFVASRLIHQ